VFDKIVARALIDQVSFSEKAVELVKCGIFDYEESERHEPYDPSKNCEVKNAFGKNQ